MREFFKILLLVYAASMVHAQSSALRDTMIMVSFGNGPLGAPYRFLISSPSNAQSWRLTISEFNGRVLFEDSGERWDEEGYFWTPEDTALLFSGVNYVVSISFFNDLDRLISTEIKRFTLPLQMDANRAPTLFFKGYSTELSEEMYQGNDPMKIFDFIVQQAEDNFPDRLLLVRGHAAKVDEENQNPEEEVQELQLLSERRVGYVIEELEKRGIESNRISYAALGGNEQISMDRRQRWKNRRVEFFFVAPPVREQEPISEPIQSLLEESMQPSSLPLPVHDMPILGSGKTQLSQIVAFILYNVPSLEPEYVRKIGAYYIQEANREGIDYDIAIAQMLLETDFLRFTGDVSPAQYNFAGIGAIQRASEGHWFPSELIGIRAHIQHLKGYATKQFLTGELVDPRYPILERLGLVGTAPTVLALSGRWSSDPDYGSRIISIVRRLYHFANALILSR